MRFLTLVLAAIIGLCSAHDEYHGSCPVLTPMSGFNWDKVSIFWLRFASSSWAAIIFQVLHTYVLSYVPYGPEKLGSAF